MRKESKVEKSRGNVGFLPYPEVELPFIGYVTAEKPLEMLATYQTIAVPECLVQIPDKTYALRVRGNGLAAEMIGEGDLLLIEARSEPSPGETILGSLENQIPFIKRYFPQNESIHLQGLSSFASSLSVSKGELIIRGILIGMLRFFH